MLYGNIIERLVSFYNIMQNDHLPKCLRWCLESVHVRCKLTNERYHLKLSDFLIVASNLFIQFTLNS